MGKEELKTLQHKAMITAEEIRDFESRKRTVRLKVTSCRQDRKFIRSF
jgi:hypothetical protein